MGAENYCIEVFEEDEKCTFFNLIVTISCTSCKLE